MPKPIDSNTYDPYRIDSIQEIDQILKEILDQQLLLRMHDGNKNNAVITTLLDIDFDNGSMVIDSAAQQTMNLQLVEKQAAYFEALLNQVSIEFYVEPLSSIVFEGKTALFGPLPNYLRRIQRRSSFRVQPLTTNPAHCKITADAKTYILPIFDISAGGISLLDEDDLLEDYSEKTIPNCILSLPEIGDIKVTINIVRQHTHTFATGKKVSRYGFSFINTSASEQIRIQNYLNQVERQQIARDRGLA